MTRRQSQIFFGDLVRAFDRLRPEDEKTRESIARLLGLADDDEEEEARPQELEDDTQEDADAVDDDVKEDGGGGGEPPATVEGGKAVESRLEEETTASAQGTPPDWLRLAGKLNHTAAPSAPAAGREPAPLFVERWVRGIVIALVSTRSFDGPLDVERIVESVARREPVVELPRLPVLTMRGGLQLLLDIGDGMLPFAHDQVRLLRDIRQVVGDDRATILRFTGCPTRGAGHGPKRTWKPYEPPFARTPVLMLTDLGIGRQSRLGEAAAVEEWLDFAALLRRAECPLAAFVPYPRARWPERLARVMHIVEWDRPTTAAIVRSLVGRGLEVKS